MQLYILDKDPLKSASKIPDKYKFKMLIELGQLVCSADISDVYKKINQGKELQQWVFDNKCWVYHYFEYLLNWSKRNINMKKDTVVKLDKIHEDFAIATLFDEATVPTHAYFRYHKDYKCAVKSKTLLPIEKCVEQYIRYLIRFKKDVLKYELFSDGFFTHKTLVGQLAFRLHSYKKGMLKENKTHARNGCHYEFRFLMSVDNDKKTHKAWDEMVRVGKYV